jgi:transposase
MGRPHKYSAELIERAVRMALESGRPVSAVAADLGMDPDRLRRYVQRSREEEAEERRLPEVVSAERAEILRLRREVAELQRANEILKAASVFFAKQLDADRPK